MSTVTWPDTRLTDPPADDLYASAVWLLGRHPALGGLAQRVPGVVTVTSDGPGIDLDVLAGALRERDELGLAWADYRRSRPEPEEETAAERWEAAGPPLGRRGSRALAVMSRTEVARLRLLAIFAATARSPLSVRDLGGLDEQGQALVRDWCAAVQAATAAT